MAIRISRISAIAFLQIIMSYALARRELRTPKMLEELGLRVEASRLRAIIGDFAFYLNSGRFKVLRLKRGYIEAIVRGFHGEWHTRVDIVGHTFECSCPHHRFRKALCKHVLLLLELYVFLRNETRELRLVRNFLETFRERLL